MWICFNDGFVSAVVSDNPEELKVRARRREHLETLFPTKTIHVDNMTDYKYRIFCSKEEWAEVVLDRINNMKYDNFKNSVVDDELHDLYENFWFLHRRYQG